ncbi:MAG: protein-disulfide reductase DsbD family protein [Tepidisphaeraceae bacterium]
MARTPQRGDRPARPEQPPACASARGDAGRLRLLRPALIELGFSNESFLIINDLRERFEDTADGAFFFTDKNAEDLIVRQKVAADSPLPSGNAVAATVCDRLGFSESAARALAAFAVQANHHGPSMCATLQAILQLIERHGPLRVEVSQGETARLAQPAELAEHAVNVLWTWAGETSVNLELRVTPGMHLAAGTVEITSPDTSLAGVGRPMASRKQYPYADEPVDVYDGSVVFNVQLHQGVVKGETLKLAIRYQPCTDTACLPTVTKTIDVAE